MCIDLSFIYRSRICFAHRYVQTNPHLFIIVIIIIILIQFYNYNSFKLYFIPDCVTYLPNLYKNAILATSLECHVFFAHTNQTRTHTHARARAIYLTKRWFNYVTYCHRVNCITTCNWWGKKKQQRNANPSALDRMICTLFLLAQALAVQCHLKIVIGIFLTLFLFFDCTVKCMFDVHGLYRFI